MNHNISNNDNDDDDDENALWLMMMTMMIFPMTMTMMMDPSKRRISLIQILLVNYEFISYSTGKTSIVFKDFEKDL